MKKTKKTQTNPKQLRATKNYPQKLQYYEFATADTVLFLESRFKQLIEANLAKELKDFFSWQTETWCMSCQAH